MIFKLEIGIMLSKVLNTFENIMENRAISHNISKYIQGTQA